MECYMHRTLHHLHVVCCGAFQPAHSVIVCSCMTVTSTCVQDIGKILADESFTNCSKSKVLQLKFCNSLNYQPHTFLWRTFCKVKIVRIWPNCKNSKL